MSASHEMFERSSSSNTALDGALHVKVVDKSVRALIASALWGITILHNQKSPTCSTLDPYFDYYVEETTLALQDRGKDVIVRSHRDLMYIVDLLRKSLVRDQLLTELAQSPHFKDRRHSVETLAASIDLTVRILTMIEVGHIPNSFKGRRPQLWTEGSLNEEVASTFGCVAKLSTERVKLEKFFKAANLERIAGIRILLTNNLADHLRMSGDDSEIEIFGCACFLEAAVQSKLFPNGFVEETMRTIRLLFPTRDAATARWFRQEGKRSKLDPRLIQLGGLRAEDRQIDSFDYWRDRIIILKQAFDESTPKTWSQWWFDRRNGFASYPVLLAGAALIMTAFFGLVQCIEGALQVFKAYHPTAN